MQEAPAVGVQVQQVKKRVLKVTDVAGEIVAELVKQKKHQVTDAISSKTLARFLLNTLNGIRILEKTARSKDEVQSMIDVALRSVL